MRVLIAGSRTFNNFDYMCQKFLIEGGQFVEGRGDGIDLDELEIVSGGAQGADKLAERLADLIGVDKRIFYPDWTTHGRSAGIIRNAEMAEYCGSEELALIFWDGKSKGSADMIRKARNYGMEVKVFTDWVKE